MIYHDAKRAKGVSEYLHPNRLGAGVETKVSELWRVLVND